MHSALEEVCDIQRVDPVRLDVTNTRLTDLAKDRVLGKEAGVNEVARRVRRNRARAHINPERHEVDPVCSDIRRWIHCVDCVCTPRVIEPHVALDV